MADNMKMPGDNATVFVQMHLRQAAREYVFGTMLNPDEARDTLSAMFDQVIADIDMRKMLREEFVRQIKGEIEGAARDMTRGVFQDPTVSKALRERVVAAVKKVDHMDVLRIAKLVEEEYVKKSDEAYWLVEFILHEAGVL